jgi:L-amino acid N-acyltransferase YncA
MAMYSLSATREAGAATIGPAKPGDGPAIRQLLHSLDLPDQGIENAMTYFWVARGGEGIVGSVGLEVYADLVLLRSLAVARQWQGRGLGRALTDTALSYIAARQYRAVYLLTTTAEAFFACYGFHSVPRTQVPVSVQQSVEFQSACPHTATCMVRTLTYPISAPVSELTIRTARFSDLPAIREIRNQGILDRIATLDTEPHTMEEIQEWFHRHGLRQPVLVAETPAGQAGWISLNVFNPRQAYQYVADLSVYVAREWRGKGIGTQLLQAIIPLARQLEYHKIVLSAFPFNPAGMRLYERQGFTTVGIYKDMGWVDGQWVDTIIMEKLLNQT